MEIGDIGNYYGCLSVKKEESKFFWSIEDFSGHLWQEIPESLYEELLKFNDSEMNNGT